MLLGSQVSICFIQATTENSSVNDPLAYGHLHLIHATDRALTLPSLSLNAMHQLRITLTNKLRSMFHGTCEHAGRTPADPES